MFVASNITPIFTGTGLEERRKQKQKKVANNDKAEERKNKNVLMLVDF